MTTDAATSAIPALTDAERAAELSPEQLQPARRPGRVRRQRRPVPGDRLGRGGLRGRQRHPDRALLTSPPSAWSWSPTPARRPATATTRRSCSRAARAGSSSRAASRRTARCSTTTARTATASSTSPSRCPTSTGASTHARAIGRHGRAGADDVTDEHGTVRIAAIAAYGDTRHTAGRPLALRRAVPARLRRAHVGLRQARRVRRSGCSRPSTTSSATSSSARWTSGSASTTGSWAS